MTQLGFGTRCAILAFTGIGLSSIVSALLVYRSTTQTAAEQIGSELLGVANAASMLVGPESRADLDAANSQRLPDEATRKRLLKPLEAVLQSSRIDGAVPGLWVFRKAPGFPTSQELETVVFIENAAQRPCYPGRRSLAGTHHLQALLGKPSFTGVYSDFDGSWISAAAPLRNPRGEIVGLVQAELPSQVAQAEALQSVSLYAGAGATCALILLLPAFYWGHLIDRRLQDLSSALASAADGKFKRHPNLDRKTVIGGVIANFNVLIERLKAARHDTDIRLRTLASEGQQARRSGKSQMQFLANVSHEMRNTINGVIGLNHILLDTPLSPEQLDLARTVQQTSQSLLALLNDIMDYSSIESGSLSFAELPFDLRSVVESTLESFAPQAQHKGLELVGWVDDSVPSPLRGDPGRIRQVLSNLLSNAIKYTESGEVMLAVLAADVTDRDVLLNINVRDTGMGVDDSAAPHLFKITGHRPPHASRQSSGTGLGLAISRKIVETLHGSIGFESGVGGGSTFWFTMRLPQLETSAPLSRLDPNDAHGLRVLVVDDNPTFLKVFGQHLASVGVRYDTVADGVDALRYLHRDAAAGVPHSLVLVDAHLEAMDALTLARTIHEDPKICQTKIALLTHMSDRKNSTDVHHRAIWTCLRKPVRRGELFECLSQLIADPKAQASTPAPADPPAPASILPLPPPQDAPAPKPLRVLLAEDDPINQRLTRHLLRRMGYSLEVVSNGRQAVEAAAHFDVILMDCFMPELDGYDAARAIRQPQAGPEASSRRTRRPYIIAMTAQALDGDREKCLDAGMDDYISKPVELEILRDALQRAEARLEAQPRAA